MVQSLTFTPGAFPYTKSKQDSLGLKGASERSGLSWSVTIDNLATEDTTSENIGSTENISDDGSEMAYDAVSTLYSPSFQNPNHPSHASSANTPDANKCRLCPPAFHQKHLERICPSYDTGTLNVLYPHHYCVNCERAASQVGRLLFCCK